MPYLDLPQGSIWYEEQGSGEPLVLLHGGAVDSRFFEHNVGPLSEHFRVIATDLWGHGRTGKGHSPLSRFRPTWPHSSKRSPAGRPMSWATASVRPSRST
jgi:pimeloyl-ACP methyl ester carboxylesterase